MLFSSIIQISDTTGVRLQKFLPLIAAFLVYSTVHFSATSAELNMEIEGVIVPGISLEEIPDPNMIYYDKLTPIVLEFKTPPGLASASMLRSRILPRISCRAEDRSYPVISTSDWLFTCPLFYHMSNLLNQLYTNWTDFIPSSRGAPSASNTRNIFSTEFLTFSNSELNFDECESQLRYWRGVNNRDGGIPELKLILEKCSVASYFEDQILEYSYPVGQVYEQMRDNYVINFFGNGSTASNGGDILATLVALQSFMTLNFYSEMTRWREAITSCQNNLIPSSIVKSSRLDKALQDLRNKLTPIKFASSITSITKFYKLPIADCIFGQNSLFVRILIPVKREKTAYRAIRINQPRFLYNDEVCQVTTNSRSDGAFPFASSSYLIEKISHTLVLAGCDLGKNRRTGQLCKIPEKTNTPPPDKCLTSIINDNLEGIKTYCRLDCEKIMPPNLYSTPLVELPIIHRIESSKFMITLNQITSILIKCESAGLPDQMIPYQKYGAIELTLPCECFLMFHADKYFPYEPCTSVSISSVSSHHALPIHMVNSSYESYISSRLQPWSGKSRTYYGRRKITFPNVSLYINMTFRDEDIIEVDLFDSDEDNQSGMMTTNGTPGIGASTLESSPPIITCIDEGGQGHGSLWTMLIIQIVLTLIVLVYFLYRIYSLEKKIEMNRTTISFNNHQSQLTLSEKY